MEIGIRKISFYLGISIVLFACFFYSIYSAYFYTIVSLCLYWGVATLALLFSENWKIKKNFKTKNWFYICVFLLVIIIDRNGDMQNYYYYPCIEMFFVLIISIIVVSKPLSKTIICGFKVALLIQMVIGFYFYINPQQLMFLGPSLFHLNGTWLMKFSDCVSSGAFLGLSTHYSTSGLYMAMGFISFSVAFIESFEFKNIRNRKGLILNGGFTLLFLIALILTQKRGQLLSAVISFCVLYFVGFVRGNISKRLLRVFAIILFIAIAFVALLQIPYFANAVLRFMIQGSIDDISSGRISNLWEPAINDFLSKPLFGIGWRQFRWVYPMMQYPYGLVNNDCHNIFIQILCENGLFLGVPIYMMILTIYKKTWKSLLYVKKHVTEFLDIWQLLLVSFGYQTFFILYGITGNPLYDIQCYLPYLLCCVLSFKIDVLANIKLCYMQEK